MESFDGVFFAMAATVKLHVMTSGSMIDNNDDIPTTQTANTQIIHTGHLI